LIADKKEDFKQITPPLNDDKIRLREEISKQIKALEEIKILAERH
jgi:formate C-acetyltransferase